MFEIANMNDSNVTELEPLMSHDVTLWKGFDHKLAHQYGNSKGKQKVLKMPRTKMINFYDFLYSLVSILATLFNIMKVNENCAEKKKKVWIS